MKSLIHNGVYVPHYNYVGLSVSYMKIQHPLTPLAEQLCIQFVKKFDTPYIKDQVFVSNFLHDLACEISSPNSKGEKWDFTWVDDLESWNFSDVQEYLDEVKEKTDAMTKEEKKKATELGKAIRLKLKEHYGYAMLHGARIPLSNWAAEPACIFMSKGKNPLRGKWKLPVTESDITLNTSAVGPTKDIWGKRTWKPDEMWIASWTSPLDGKMKYVWFAPSTSIRQEKEQKKFLLASSLKKDIAKIDDYIDREMNVIDERRQKLAMIVYLIKSLAIRVGDEKIAGETGTVGCTTLKKDNVSIKGNEVSLSFIGKDYVQWDRQIYLPTGAIASLKKWMAEAGEDFIFKGLGSEDVSRFLRECIPNLSAKVFRTYIAGETWDENGRKNGNLINDGTSMAVRKYLFKMTNLAVAKKLNHKKALPKNYDERVKKAEAKLHESFKILKEKTEIGQEIPEQKYQVLRRKTEKAGISLNLLKETSEWNLGTSLNAYIDPNKVIKFAEKNLLEPKDVYSKGLLEKFSWAIKKGKE